MSTFIQVQDSHTTLYTVCLSIMKEHIFFSIQRGTSHFIKPESIEIMNLNGFRFWFYFLNINMS